MTRIWPKNLNVAVKCAAGHIFDWTSSNLHYDKKGDGINENDLLFAGSILYSGNNYAKISHFCKIFGLKCIGETSFYQYQQLYLVPAVQKFWIEHQRDVLQR